MTAEEFKEFLKDEKNKEMFDAIVQSMGYKAEDNYKTLEADRDAERKRKREYQEKLQEMEKKLAELENKYYIDDDKADSKNKNPIEKLEREISKLKQANEKEAEKAAALQSKYYNSVRQSEIIKALEAANVDPVHYNLLISAFSQKAQIEADDDRENVIIENKSAGDFFKDWAAGDGKAYIKQAVNSGSGANNFSGASGKKEMKADAFNLLPPKERASFMASGGQIIE